MKSMQSKIFGIGLSKTGTSSLAQALQILGYKTLDNMGVSRYAAGDLASIDLPTVDADEALTDTPIPSFYRELDARYPGSKFILTLRDREGWLKSCMKQFSPRFGEQQSEPNKRLFEDLYGTNVFDEAGFSAGYELFVAGVREYFKDRPGDLLELNVTAGEGWEKLCPFLGQPVPDVPFPKANVTQIRWIRMEDLIAVAEEAGQALLQWYEGELAADVQRTGIGAGSAGRRLLGRAMQAALGRDAAVAAMKAAHKVAVAGLKKLNPAIAIVSPVEDPAPYAERKTWNHVWLVDPLDGREAFAGGSAEFSVNLALIEDGRPIYGAVHAPAKGVMFYGRSGKGAFKRSSGGEVIRFELTQVAASGDATADAGVQSGKHSSVALALCKLLEEWPAASPIVGQEMEWAVAPADAILAAAGLRVCEPASHQSLRYNQETLLVGSGRVSR